MSSELDALIALAADYSPITASLSPDTLAVFGYAYSYLSSRLNWLGIGEVPADITDADWDVIEAMVAEAYTEIFRPMIGQIVDIVTSTIPPNMLLCDGSTYLRVDYPELYAVLDTAFIVDADHFIVPDYQGRVTVGFDAGTYSLGVVGGLDSVTLTTTEIPSHDHVASAPTVVDPTHSHVEVAAVPTLITIGAGVPSPSAIPSASTTAPALTGISVLAPIISPTGGDGAHENRQPFGVAKKVIIAN